MPFPDCRSLLPFVFALTAVAGACRSGPAAPPLPKPVSADVWAVVDGQEIHREEVEKTYRRTMPRDQVVSDDDALTAKLNVLDQLIIEQIMLAKARELKIELPEAELDAAYNDGKKNISDEAFNKELAARNLTPTDVRDELRRELTAQKVIQHEATSKITVNDRDVNDFFQANKAQFNLTEDAYHLAQIVVTPVKDSGLTNRTGDDATTPQAAATKAQMLMERLKSGTPFAELAMDYSEDPDSAPRGGDVGLVPASALRQAAPQLRDAVMKAKPGSVTAVSIDGGYTIVALVARQAAGQRDPSMPEVRDGITATVRGQRELLLRTAYVAALRNKATVVNHAAERLVEAEGKLPPSIVPVAPK